MEPPPLEPETAVYRGVRNKHFDKETRRVLAAEFLRRPGGDNRGLSVSHHCRPIEAAPNLSNIWIHRLNVDFIRQLDLDVVPDTAVHANIVGVPRPEENLERANEIAESLARHAVFEVHRRESLA